MNKTLTITGLTAKTSVEIDNILKQLSKMHKDDPTIKDYKEYRCLVKSLDELFKLYFSFSNPDSIVLKYKKPLQQELDYINALMKKELQDNVKNYRETVLIFSILSRLINQIANLEP